jgi:hypothetical protein
MSWFSTPPFTPAVRRVQMLLWRYILVMAWGVFPLTLIAVYAATFAMIGRDPRFPAGEVSAGGVLALALVFIGAAALFWFLGRFARAQIRRMKAGGPPWPWPEQR